MVKIITMLTDFGLKDGNVGVMKGVIWGICPQAQIADLSHTISPQNILEGALVLSRSAPYFPPGSVHVAVVDPGVGTSRRPIAAQLGEHFFVGPDNGLVTLLLEWAESQGEQVQFVHLDNPHFWLPQVSHVFHGRDIFAPAAAHLANGVPLREIGTPITDPIRLPLPPATRTVTGWLGQVIHIDHFGNISSNLRREHLGERGDVTVRLCGVNIQGLVSTFGERPSGNLVALYGSTGSLLVCEVNGNAARRLEASIGDPFEVIFD